MPCKKPACLNSELPISSLNQAKNILKNGEKEVRSEESTRLPKALNKFSIVSGSIGRVYPGRIDFFPSLVNPVSNEINEQTRTITGDEQATVLKRDPVVSGLKVGMTLKGRFVLENVLGQGGMGTIFKARDLLKEEMQDRKPFVAIKVLHPKLQRNDSLVRALQREARKSQELAHPNIVNVHDFDRDGQYVFMVMEYLQGKPLNELIEQGDLKEIPLRDRWTMIEKIGRGIAYAHEQKVIHYDIKPGNVFICNDGNVKILDFGIAKARRSSSEENMTVFDQFSPDALTPAYATCEMLRWEPPDVRDDVYAFGCVAYEILTGKHPFNKMPALKAVKAGLTPRPIKDLPKQQWLAIKATLEFKREDRMQDIVHFLKSGYGKRDRKQENLKFLAALTGLLAVLAVGIVIWHLNAYQEGTSDQPDGSEKRTAQQEDKTFRRIGAPPPAEIQRKIDRILKIAESHISVGRIVEPPGSSAVDAYETILDLDPESPEARSGIRDALRYCEKEARDRLQKGENDRASELIGRCLSINPNQPGLEELRTELKSRQPEK